MRTYPPFQHRSLTDSALWGAKPSAIINNSPFSGAGHIGQPFTEPATFDVAAQPQLQPTPSFESKLGERGGARNHPVVVECGLGRRPSLARDGLIFDMRHESSRNCECFCILGTRFVVGERRLIEILQWQKARTLATFNHVISHLYIITLFGTW